jgi:hypothetical protein
MELLQAGRASKEADYPWAPDAVDFADTKTHWYTGHRGLKKDEFGDDSLFGPLKVLDLDDALRRWLTLHPDAMNRLRTSTPPSGPLAITHRTGRRKSRSLCRTTQWRLIQMESKRRPVPGEFHAPVRWWISTSWLRREGRGDVAYRGPLAVIEFNRSYW